MQYNSKGQPGRIAKKVLGEEEGGILNKWERSDLQGSDWGKRRGY